MSDFLEIMRTNDKTGVSSKMVYGQLSDPKVLKKAKRLAVSSPESFEIWNFLGRSRDSIFMIHKEEEKAWGLIEQLRDFLGQECQLVRKTGRGTFSHRVAFYSEREIPMDGIFYLRYKDIPLVICLGTIQHHFDQNLVCFLDILVSEDHRKLGIEVAQRFSSSQNNCQGKIYNHKWEEKKLKRAYKWDELIMPEPTIDLIKKNTLGFLENRSRYQEYDLRCSKNLLFYGEPGNGKTLCTKILASTGQYAVLWLTPSAFVTAYKWSEVLRDSYEWANKLPCPAIILMEDIDLFFGDRTTSPTLFGELLTVLDGLLEYANGVTMIASTNRPEVLDKAIGNRPYRFDCKINFPSPNFEFRKAFLERSKVKARYADNINIDNFAALTEGFSGAHMGSMISDAIRLALDQKSYRQDGKALIQDQHLQEAFRETKALISQRQKFVGFEKGNAPTLK